MDPPTGKHNSNDDGIPDARHDPANTPDKDPGPGDGSNERLISALQVCFADLVKKNEEQMNKLQTAVEGLRVKPPVTDKKTKFWNLYKTLADEHDKEFLQKYSTDLDTSLIFVCSSTAI
ncbi:hypothetical protein C8R44DRAFT_805899 [Mycena epipterygia]|nr:hypothetical protein C8R44DRAFT_805899 [Mycena epipterygia]